MERDCRDIFSFKKFKVHHGKSSMKVGVDAVLLGAWVNPEGESILEVGSGCGVISLMVAQRNHLAKIEAIEIDASSVNEAKLNFEESPWKHRLEVRNANFPQDILGEGKKFDLIISNPPYFCSGINKPVTSRERARHQDTLSVFTLLSNAGALLKEGGRLAMIFPTEFREESIRKGAENCLYLQRECLVRNNHKRPFKRVMMEFGFTEPKQAISEEITLFEDNLPTGRYRELCEDFYLKF